MKNNKYDNTSETAIKRLLYLQEYSTKELLEYVDTPYIQNPNLIHAIENHRFEIDFRLTMLYPLFVSEMKFQAALDNADYKQNNKIENQKEESYYISFGEKCRFFKKLSIEQQQVIIKELGFEKFEDNFSNWINAFSKLRNRCAHNMKICNINYKNSRHNITTLKEHTKLYRNKNYIFIHVLYLSLFLNQGEFKIFVKKLQSLFKVHYNIKPEYIPFRNNWKDLLEEFYNNNYADKAIYLDLNYLPDDLILNCI